MISPIRLLGWVIVDKQGHTLEHPMVWTTPEAAEEALLLAVEVSPDRAPWSKVRVRVQGARK